MTYASDEIKGANGGKLNGFEDYPVVNRVPGEKPVCVAATTTEDMKHIEIRFDKEMEDPAGKKEQFGVLVNGYVNEVENVEMKTGSASKTYVLTLKEPIGKNNLVHVSYTRGDVKAVNGAELETFVNRPVVNTATVLVVNKNVSWNYVTISSAINAAVDGDTITVYPGTYKESFAFGGKAITLTSTDPVSKTVVESTIIDAENNGPVIGFMNGEDRDSMLMGFTITNGNTIRDSAAQRAYNTYGGGITVIEASPTIAFNIIKNNTSVNGGGILVIGGSPLIGKNEIADNTATQPEYSGERDFDGAYGGGICFMEYHDDSVARKTMEYSPTVFGNLLKENEAEYGAGIYVGEGYQVLGLLENEWKHFNSPYSSVEYVENGTGFDIYQDNVLTNVRRIAENTDGRDIAYYAKTTPTGILDLRPASGTEKDDIIMNIDYVAGCDFDNASITFVIPSGFTVSTDAKVKIGTQEQRNLTAAEISGQSVTVKDIDLTEDSTVTLTLEEQKTPTGLEESDTRDLGYTFKAKSDADGNGMAWEKSEEINDDFTSKNLSICTDFRINTGNETYLKLLTESATSVKVASETTVEKVIKALESTDGSTQTYEIKDVSGKLDDSHELTGPATLTVTAAHGNSKEYAMSINPTLFVRLEKNMIPTSGTRNGITNSVSWHDSIQEAIDNSTDGSTVTAWPSTYGENITFGGKAITLTSTDPASETVVASTVIDGGNTVSVVTFNNGEGRDSVINGFTITNGNGTPAYASGARPVARTYGGGISITSASPTILNNVIKNNTSVNGGGILVAGGSPLIAYNEIRDNTAEEPEYDASARTDWGGRGGGIYLENGGRKSSERSSPPTPVAIQYAVIYSNVIETNTANYGAGIYVGSGYVVLNADETGWKHFNSPECDVEFVENTANANNEYYGNILEEIELSGARTREAPARTDGRDIGWYRAETPEGTLTLRPATGTERENVTINMDYEIGGDYHNGKVLFCVPDAFTLSTAAKVKIGDAVARNITQDEIDESEDKTVGIGGITEATGTTVTLTLEDQEIPTGLAEVSSSRDASPRNIDYTFKTYGNADGEGDAWYNSNENEATFTSVNLSICTDFRIKTGNGTYLKLLTESATSVKVASETTVEKVIKALESTDGSTQTYEIKDVSGKLNDSHELTGPATLTVTAARGNSKEYAMSINPTLFVRLEKNMIPTSGTRNGITNSVSWHDSIGEAITESIDGSTVTAWPSVYGENITFGGKAITLTSTDPASETVVASTVIDGGNTVSVVTFNNGEGRDSVINGFTITNGNGTPAYASGARPVARTYGGGISITSASPTILNNVIKNNTSVNGGGILVAGGSPLIAYNEIRDNTAEEPEYDASARIDWGGRGGGIYLENGARVSSERSSPPTPAAIQYAVIYSNVIEENTARYGAGIYVGSGYVVLNADETGWKHFNSPECDVEFVENTANSNNEYYGNILEEGEPELGSARTREAMASTDGRDIGWYSIATPEGTLTLRPATGTERENVIMNMDYEIGGDYRNGKVFFRIPYQFKLSTAAKVKIGDAVARNITQDEILGTLVKAVAIGGITEATGTTVTLTLEDQEIPTGLAEVSSSRDASPRNIDYTFKTYGNADCEGDAWYNSNEIEATFTSVNLSICTDFSIKTGFDYLTLITGSATRVQFDRETAGQTTAASITSALTSKDGSVQEYAIYKADEAATVAVNGTDIMPDEATLTVTSTRGDKKEYRIYKPVFKLTEEGGQISFHETIAAAIDKISSGEKGTIEIATDKISEVSKITILGKNVLIKPATGISAVTFDGKNSHRVFEISNGASVTLNKAIVTNGLEDGTWAGGIFIQGNSTLTLNDSTVTNNSVINCGGATNGGGIDIFDNSTLYAYNTIITGNALTNDSFDYGNGGGIGILYGCSAFLENCTVTNNTAQSNGGGIYILGGTLNISNTSITDNIAFDGGGVYMNDVSTFNFNSGKISDNTATANGGGIFRNSGYLKTNDNAWNPELGSYENDFSVDGSGNITQPLNSDHPVSVSGNTAGTAATNQMSR